MPKPECQKYKNESAEILQSEITVMPKTRAAKIL